jgi:hypothetical protein
VGGERWEGRVDTRVAMGEDGGGAGIGEGC